MNLNQIGLVGLGVMGKSLAQNFLEKGVKLSVYNRQVPGREINLAINFEKENPGALGFDDYALFVASLERPRKILIMVLAGQAVDYVIDSILPFLEKGDIIMDGGNSHYSDTQKRVELLSSKGILFLGIGVSGGQEGARKGPSLMPGGPIDAYKSVGNYLEIIAAKDNTGQPCCAYIGPDGAGHFIKMVHNGIEYAEMQILAEIYYIMRFMLGYSTDHISGIFKAWNTTEEGSYLLGITAEILLKKEGNELLLDKILDIAEQKETGGWSVKAALDLKIPVNTISDAVNSRLISMFKETRITASILYDNIRRKKQEGSLTLEELKAALSAARYLNHIIGFNMIKLASEKYIWNLNLSEIARIWTSGCIIKSHLMEKLSRNLKENEDLLFHPETVLTLNQNYEGLAKVVSTSVSNTFSVPVLSSSLLYFMNMIEDNGSSNLIQAQRDFFGSHTYKRVDKDPKEIFHTEW